MKYCGTPIPQTLQKHCEDMRSKICEVYCGDGYCTPTGKAYDILLNTGFCAGEEGLHTIIEGNVRDAIKELKRVIPCYCSICDSLGLRVQ